MVCTEERNMVMKKGKKFSTGNHPVEMLVPMLHYTNAGFEIDVYTPTGDPVKIEMSAMPSEDKNVVSISSIFEYCKLNTLGPHIRKSILGSIQ